MSLMGTLTKIAIGYAAARGVDRMGGVQGLAGLFGGATVAPDKASAQRTPGMGQLQDMMAQVTGGSGMAGMKDMMASFAGGKGIDLSSIMAGFGKAEGGSESGLLSSQPGGQTGLAGVFAALGGAAAMTGKGTGAMLDQLAGQAKVPQAEETAGLMLRAMIQAAKADGKIDKAEEAKIMELLGDADADDIAFMKAQLKAPLDVESLAADTPAALAMQVYSMSLMPIRVDTEAEAEYLDQLASGLGLTQEVVNALHLQMGVKPLYA